MLGLAKDTDIEGKNEGIKKPHNIQHFTLEMIQLKWTCFHLILSCIFVIISQVVNAKT